MALTPFLKGYLIFLFALLGLVMGSFLNCMAIRIVKGESIAKGRSHCMNCGHTLGVSDLIPLFSWLFLRGKCRYCGARIAFRYFLAELCSGVVFVSLYLHFGLCPELAEYLILASLLLCISFADLEDYLVPDGLLLAGIACRVIFMLFSENIGAAALQSLIGGLSISLPLLLVVLLMERIWKKDAMGGGDIKLVFVMGLYCHWSVNLFSFLVACVLGILCGLLLPKLKNAEKQFPFGPSLALGWWLGLLFGEKVISWYLSLF